MDNGEILIGEGTRSNGSAIRCTESIFKGKKYIGVRIWDSVNGEYRPTSKGLSIEADNEKDEDALLAACQAAVAHIQNKRKPAIVKGPPKRRPAGQKAR